MDDGQVVCEPGDVEVVLRTIDDEAFKVGLARGRGTSAKTVCRLMGSSIEKTRVGTAWYTEYVSESSVQCSDNDLEGHVLGINFDDSNGMTHQFREASAKAHESRFCAKWIDDVGCELAVTQSCLSVCKVVHLLRAAGPFIAPDALLAHDTKLLQSLNELVGCEVPAESRLQAACSTKSGGLGLRKVADLALPTFIASRVDSREAVETLVRDWFGDDLTDLLMELYDDEVTSAIRTLKSRLPTNAAFEIEACLLEARENQKGPGPLRRDSDYLIAPAGGVVLMKLALCKTSFLVLLIVLT